MAKSYAKYELDPDAKDVHGRFAALYEESSRGKNLLTAQCIVGGMLLRECGLLGMVTEICESPAYIAATSTGERRALLLGELMALSPVLQGMAVAAPVAMQEPTHTQHTQMPSEEQPQALGGVDGTEDEAATQLRPRPTIKKPGITLPNLGASSTPDSKK